MPDPTKAAAVPTPEPPAAESPETLFDRLARLLRIAVDGGCFALLAYALLSGKGNAALSALGFWLPSLPVFPHARVASYVRNKPEVQRALFAFGLGVIALALYQLRWADPDSLRLPRGLLQGLLFVLAGWSNWLSSRTPPEEKHLSAGRFLLGVAALVSGGAWVWLQLTP